MKIINLRLEENSSSIRAAATVIWETCPRPPLELWFETDVRFAGGFGASADAFLTACYLPGIRSGERRVFIEGVADPRLTDGLRTAALLLASWYGPSRLPIPIEPVGGFVAPTPPKPRRAACCLTGGFDSLHLIYANRNLLPADHPDSFRDALHVSKLFFPRWENSVEAGGYTTRVVAALSDVASDAGLTLIPVATNLRQLHEDLAYLADEYIAAALAAAAHCFSRRWSSLTLGSGRDVPRLLPRGTHPLLDPLFSTSATEIRHSGIRYSRLAKVRAISGWDAGVRNLIVCLHPLSPTLNCGQCEKCVRAMTELLVVGRLETAAHFPVSAVTPEMVERPLFTGLVSDYWTDLIPPLEAQGRGDLIAAIHRKLVEAEHLQKWFDDRNWSGRLRRFDRVHLGGRLLSLSRRLRSGAPTP